MQLVTHVGKGVPRTFDVALPCPSRFQLWPRSVGQWIAHTESLHRKPLQPSLKGTYVYQIHAIALVNGVSIVPYRQVGVFTADGAGGITGTDDSSVTSAGTPIQGSYQIFSDGTGQITFNTSSLGAIQFAVTMVSTSKVQMIENDSSLNAAGVAELQDTTAAGTTPSGTFVFRLHQEAAAQNPSTEEASQVGGFSLTSGSGSGAMDQILGTTSTAALTSPNLTVTFNALQPQAEEPPHCSTPRRISRPTSYYRERRRIGAACE
jgi:hypothetical protein